MTYGVRAYGARAYGDSSLGGAASATGDGNITLTGIPSSVAMGVPTVGLAVQDIVPNGIASSVAMGTPLITTYVTLTGIATSVAMGTPVVVQQVIIGIPPRSGIGTLGVMLASPPLPALEPGSRHNYELRVVDVWGNKYCVLDGANLRRAVWELNGAGIIEFSISAFDEKAAELVPIEREVQLWRDGVLIHWGVIVRPSATLTAEDATLSFQCPGVMWHLGRRYFGRADRTNYLPSFQSGQWSAVGVTADFWNTERYIDNGMSLKMTQASDETETYVKVNLTPMINTGVGAAMFIAGRFFIDDAAWVGPAILSRGITAVRTHVSGGSGVAAGESEELEPVTIDSTTPRGEWVEWEVVINEPAGHVDNLELRLYAPGGIIWHNQPIGVLMESLATYADGTSESDLARYMGRMVEHAQDASLGKSDLNILPNTPLLGRKFDKAHQYADHEEILATILSYTTMDGAFDIGMVLTPTTRTFTTYAPQKGVHHPELALVLGRNIDAATYQWDGEAGASYIVVLGAGSGPTRAEGFAVDAAAFGGVTVEHVETAPIDLLHPDWELFRLDPTAAERLKAMKRPEKLQIKSVDPYDALFGSLVEGDTVPVWLPIGNWRTLEGDWRVTQCALMPEDEGEAVVYDLVPVT